MSLDRKDVRVKLDPDVHAALREICEIEDIEMSEWAERLVADEVARRVHEANLLSDKTKHLGFVGNRRDSRGIALNTLEPKAKGAR